MAKDFFRRQEEAHGAVWLTHWKLPEDFALTPPEHDYRDRFPVRPEDVAAQYAPVVRVSTLRLAHVKCILYGANAWHEVVPAVVQDGTWTFGAFQCWGKRQKVARVRFPSKTQRIDLTPVLAMYMMEGFRKRGLECERRALCISHAAPASTPTPASGAAYALAGKQWPPPGTGSCAGCSLHWWLTAGHANCAGA